MTEMIDTSAFTNLVVRAFKQEVKGSPLEKVGMAEQYTMLVGSVEKKNIKVEDGSPAEKINSA